MEQYVWWECRVSISITRDLQGLQELSGLFEMALTGRKKVAMSKLMVAPNGQRKDICKYIVRFYIAKVVESYYAHSLDLVWTLFVVILLQQTTTNDHKKCSDQY